MTVAAATRFISFNGSGSTGPFTFNFRILIRTNLSPMIKVTKISTAGVRTTLALTTDYTFVASGGGLTGGAVTTLVAIASGERLTIEGLTDVDQNVDYANQGDFAPETHEMSYDKLTMIVQEAARTSGLAIHIPATDTAGLTTELPANTVRAGKLVAFDDDGDVTVSTLTLTQVEASGSVRIAVSDADARTFALDDSDRYVRYTGTGGHAFTVPPSASVDFPDNTEIDVFNAGSGNLTLTAGTGVIVNGVTAGSVTLPPFSGGSFKNISGNTWDYNGFGADAWA